MSKWAEVEVMNDAGSTYLPMCAGCGRKVDRLVDWGLDPATCRWVFSAFCHGQEEQTALGLVDIGCMSGGVAFATKRLECAA
jgi:hypothetical protein